MRRAQATETKIRTRKKAVTTVTAITKKAKQRERIPPRTHITKVRDEVLREALVLHRQGAVNLSSYCQKQMGIHRLLCTPSHQVTPMGLLRPHIVHPPDVVPPNSTHLPSKLALYEPFPLLLSTPNVFPKLLTSPALMGTAEMKLERLQHGEKGPRQALKDEVNIAI